MVDEPAEILRRLNEGDWLRPSEVVEISGLGRTTVHRLLSNGKIGFKKSPGGQRRCKPEDVRRLLDELDREHRGEPASDTPE